MDQTPVRYEPRGPVTYLIFDRPAVLNAGDRAFVDALHDAAERLARSPDVRVAVLTGAGRAFSTGVDLDALARGDLRMEDLVRWEEASPRTEDGAARLRRR